MSGIIVQRFDVLSISGDQEHRVADATIHIRPQICCYKCRLWWVVDFPGASFLPMMSLSLRGEEVAAATVSVKLLTTEQQWLSFSSWKSGSIPTISGCLLGPSISWLTSHHDAVTLNRHLSLRARYRLSSSSSRAHLRSPETGFQEGRHCSSSEQRSRGYSRINMP